MGFCLGCSMAAFAQTEAPAQNPYKDLHVDEHATLGDLILRAHTLVIPMRKIRLGPDVLNRTWDFSAEDRGNFTTVEGVADVKTEDGNVLAFTLQDKTALLGWGNCGNKLPPRQRARFWKHPVIAFEVLQTLPDKTEWVVHLWSNGQRKKHIYRNYHKKKGRFEANRRRFYEPESEGTEWQSIEISPISDSPVDGFDLEIIGKPGNRVRIRNFHIYQPACKGYVRHTFDLPPGKVWKVALEHKVFFADKQQLYVNGLAVDADDRDLATQFKPGGKNCIGIYGFRQTYPPYIYLRGSVVMESGQRVVVDTSPAWTYHPNAPEGWSAPDFDASDWTPIPHSTRTSTGGRLRAVKGYGWMYNQSYQRPADDGYFKLANPYDNKLFYKTTDSVRVDVEIPSGFEDKAPSVKWVIKPFRQGQVVDKETREGTVDTCRREDGSLWFTLDIGTLPMGLYLVSTHLLLGDDKVLEKRLPEPLIVTGRFDMKEVQGTTYEQGLELELEKSIDLADPEGDPTPWMETGGRTPHDHNLPGAIDNDPLVVENQGMTYRITRPHRWAQISYLLTFRHPGDFYLVELEYPDDQSRHLAVSCTPDAQDTSPDHEKSLYSRCGPGVWTGGKHPVSHGKGSLKWLYRPDRGNHAFNLINLGNPDIAPAAGIRLNVFHITNPLPALKVPERNTRLFGHLTEGTRGFLGAGEYMKAFALQIPNKPSVPDEAHWRSAKPEKKPVMRYCWMVERALDGCMAFTRYLRFVGQNLFIMGCYQYSYSNEGFAPDDGTVSIQPDARDILARLLADNGIDFIANIEYNNTPDLLRAADEAVMNSDDPLADTLFLVTKDGVEAKEARSANYVCGFNINHPLVRREVCRLTDRLVHKFRHCPNFRGINILQYLDGEWMPSYRAGRFKLRPLDAGYGDTTMQIFAGETGISFPIDDDDPLRFRKRYKLLTSDTYIETWKRWRAAKIVDFFREIQESAHDINPDVSVMATIGFYPPTHTDRLAASGKTLRDFLYDEGWDGAMFAEKGITLNHIMHPTQQYLEVFALPNAGYGWDMSCSDEYFDFYRSDNDLRSVFLRHCWCEVEYAAREFPKRDHWPRPFQSTTASQAAGDRATEVFAQALVGGDPSVIMMGFSDAGFFLGHEQPMRRFAQAYQHLPRKRFAAVGKTGLRSNLALRELKQNGKHYVYAVNPGWWRVKGELVFTGTDKTINPVNGQVYGGDGFSAGRVTVPVDLRPYSLAVFVSDSAQSKVSGWTAEPVPTSAEQAHIHTMLDHVEALLADRRAVLALDASDLKFMKDSLHMAKQAFADRRYSAAWYTLTSGRFWHLKAYLKRAADYFTEDRALRVSRDRQTLRAARTGTAPVIDGKVGEAEWASAATFKGFITDDGKPSMFGTYMSALYSGDDLYLAFVCKDRRPEEIRCEATSSRELWKHSTDSLALFFQPVLTENIYYQMAFDAKGTTFEQEVVAGTKKYDYGADWDVKTRIGPDRWSAEVRFPTSCFKGAVIAPDTTWGFNVHRLAHGDRSLISHFSYGLKSWHDPEGFGRLHFK